MSGATVVYGSRYGSTETYARWVADDANAQLVALKDLKASNLEGATAVAILSPVLAGTLMFRTSLAHHAERLADLPTALVTVGVSPTDDPSRDEYVATALPHELQGAVAVFHLRGAIEYGRLGRLHRMMGLVDAKARRAFRTHPTTPENEVRAEVAGVDQDFVDRATTAPLVGWLRHHAGEDQ